MTTQDSTMPRRRASRAGLLFALLAIAAGVFILASNTGSALAVYRPIIFSWPMLVIVIGLIGFCNLLFHRRFSFCAFYVMLAGFFFLIQRIGSNEMTLFGWEIPQGFAHTYWPALLIAAGVLGVIRWIVRPLRTCSHKHWKEKGDINAVFGNSKHIILDPVFKGGEINAVFGEITLDLRKTELSEGKTTMLEVNIVFGNAVILVPESWNINLISTSIMGAFVDKRENAESPCDMTRTLEIQVHSVFSGGELHN